MRVEGRRTEESLRRREVRIRCWRRKGKGCRMIEEEERDWW